VLQVPTASSIATRTKYKAGVLYTTRDVSRWFNKSEGPDRSSWREQRFAPDASASVKQLEDFAKARSWPCLRFQYHCKPGDFIIAMVVATYDAEVWWVGRVQRVTPCAVYIKFLSKCAGLHPVM